LAHGLRSAGLTGHQGESGENPPLSQPKRGFALTIAAPGGSTNQELAIAYALEFDRLLIVNQQGMASEGMLAYIE
jgi:hypothetical protein